MPSGRCHCGAIRYELSGEPVWSSLCHCSDCRRHAGAPVVGWEAYREEALTVLQGESDSLRVVRKWQTAFLPPALLAPMIQVQAAERIAWMERAHELPAFDRYPWKG